MLRSIGAALLVLTVGSAASVARAETAAILPAGGDERLPAAVRSRAVRALRSALRQEGVRVLSTAELERHLTDSALRRCRKTDCGDDVASAAGADFAAGVAVWKGGDGREGVTVAVSLITPAGVAFPGTATVGRDGDLALATRTALAAARAKQRLGPGPWLHVVGTPVGARVSVDGTAVGVLPYRGAIRPGRHAIVVRLAGHRPVERTIDVPMADQAEARVEVALAEDPSGAATLREVHPRPVRTDAVLPAAGSRPAVHAWGPAVLGAAGLGLLAVDAVALVRRGCSFRDASGTCRRGTRLRAEVFAAYAGAGSAALVGALLWWILAPDDGAERPERAPAGLTIGPLGLHLTTRF